MKIASILLEHGSGFRNKPEYFKFYKHLYEDHCIFSLLTFMKEMSNIFVYKLLYKKSIRNILERN